MGTFLGRPSSTLLPKHLGRGPRSHAHCGGVLLVSTDRDRGYAQLAKMERPSGVEGADWSYRMIIEDRKPLHDNIFEPTLLGSTDRGSTLLRLQDTSGWP